jgi:hypothetical protein
MRSVSLDVAAGTVRGGLSWCGQRVKRRRYRRIAGPAGGAGAAGARGNPDQGGDRRIR